MKKNSLKIVVLGLSVTSSWGNSHASTYRALLRGLAERGHRVLFLERDLPTHAGARDLKSLPQAEIALYQGFRQLQDQFAEEITGADAVILGSSVPEGAAIGDWIVSIATGVTAFYDLETPLTLAHLERGDAESLSRELVPKLGLYLSSTGGPSLDRIKSEFNASMVRPLYSSFDPETYLPGEVEKTWDLGFLGTFNNDRQSTLQRLLIEPAAKWPSARFVIAGSQYPPNPAWPANVEKLDHLPPPEHRAFYNRQMFTLNITRPEMIQAGWSPSVRLFEAAACGTPIISDYWEGLEDFFELGDELLVAREAEDVLRFLQGIPSDEGREIGEAARRRVLERHTPAHRAAELESYLLELLGRHDDVSNDNPVEDPEVVAT